MPRVALSAKSVSDLLAEFNTAPATITKTPAQVERDSRVDFFNEKLSELVTLTAEYSRGTDDVDSLKKFLVALTSAKKDGVKSLSSVPDEVIDAQIDAQEAGVFAAEAPEAGAAAVALSDAAVPSKSAPKARTTTPKPPTEVAQPNVEPNPDPTGIDAALKAARAERVAAEQQETANVTSPNDEWNMPDAPAALSND